MSSTTSTMTVHDFLRYLSGREQTHDLALQLTYVCAVRQARSRA
jgi:hypothetical protein